jgi:hypothetical protein
MERKKLYKRALSDAEEWILLALKENPNSKFYKGYLINIEREKQRRS